MRMSSPLSALSWDTLAAAAVMLDESVTSNWTCFRRSFEECMSFERASGGDAARDVA